MGTERVNDWKFYVEKVKEGVLKVKMYFFIEEMGVFPKNFPVPVTASIVYIYTQKSV